MSVINHAGFSYHASQRKGHIFGYSEQIIAINVTLASETDLLGVHLDTKVCQIARASVFNTSACVEECQVHRYFRQKSFRIKWNGIYPGITQLPFCRLKNISRRGGNPSLRALKNKTMYSHSCFYCRRPPSVWQDIDTVTSASRPLLIQALPRPHLHQRHPGRVGLLEVGNLKHLYQKSSEPSNDKCDEIWRQKTHLIPSQRQRKSAHGCAV